MNSRLNFIKLLNLTRISSNLNSPGLYIFLVKLVCASKFEILTKRVGPIVEICKYSLLLMQTELTRLSGLLIDFSLPLFFQFCHKPLFFSFPLVTVQSRDLFATMWPRKMARPMIHSFHSLLEEAESWRLKNILFVLRYLTLCFFFSFR